MTNPLKETLPPTLHYRTSTGMIQPGESIPFKYPSVGAFICMECSKMVDEFNSDGHLFWCSEKCYNKFMKF